VTAEDERARFAAAAGIAQQNMTFELFRVDLDQVVLVGLNEERNGLVISSWLPGQGLTRTTRT
jgi:hypothetical protein